MSAVLIERENDCRVELLLAGLGAAILRNELAIARLDAIGGALYCGEIDAEGALRWLQTVGLVSDALMSKWLTAHAARMPNPSTILRRSNGSPHWS